MSLLSYIKEYFIPDVSPEALLDMDRDSAKNIKVISLVVAFFEVLVLAIFMATNQINDKAFVSIISVMLCILMCICGYLVADYILSHRVNKHALILLFKSLYFISLSAWGWTVSYRHYINREQMLSFFTVQLLIDCFIVFEPLISILLALVAYGGLYFFLYRFDGAARVNYLNYLIFMIASIVEMIVQFHFQLQIGRKKLELEKKNAQLEWAGRHDGLTSLRNRKALDEDSDTLHGDLHVYMVDVNRFKKINDTYGHLVGDAVLKDVSRQLKTLFSTGYCYRYGGDEFLVLINQKEEAYLHDRYLFTCQLGEDVKRIGNPISSIDVSLSIGHVIGFMDSTADLYSLIKKADEKLYHIKAQLAKELPPLEDDPLR